MGLQLAKLKEGRDVFFETRRQYEEAAIQLVRKLRELRLLKARCVKAEGGEGREEHAACAKEAKEMEDDLYALWSEVQSVEKVYMQRIKNVGDEVSELELFPGLGVHVIGEKIVRVVEGGLVERVELALEEMGVELGRLKLEKERLVRHRGVVWEACKAKRAADHAFAKWKAEGDMLVEAARIFERMRSCRSPWRSTF